MFAGWEGEVIMDHTYACPRKDIIEFRTDCLCDLCCLKKYQNMENMCIEERNPPFNSPPWFTGQQSLVSPPRFILPKQPSEPSPLRRSCGLAYDHKDLPKLVAVHSLHSAPSHLMYELDKATVYPPRRNIGPLLQQVQPKSTASDENATMHSYAENKESSEPKQSVLIQNKESSEPKQLIIAKSPNKPLAELPTDEKDMGKLLTKIKKSILKIQLLRKSFHEELQNQTKRTILDQLLHEREELKEMRELLQTFVQEGEIGNASEILNINEINELDSNKPREVEDQASPKPSTTTSNGNTEGYCTTAVGDDEVASEMSSEPQSTEISCSEGPANIDKPNAEVCPSIQDNGAVDKDGEEHLDRPLTGYVRCAGVLEKRSEGDNFICDYDEWTMQLYEGTHKAVFKRRGSKRKGSLLDNDDQDDTEPPEKRPSVESSDEGYEADSYNEQSDVEVFSLETQNRVASSSPTPHMTESTCSSSSTLEHGDGSEMHDAEEEVEDAIMKLERRCQIREAKINHLTQKRERLIDELRRVKLSTRDS
ncbi:uncharacterized protein LOC110242034 [Exaiptasia diaphana]|uniref:Uncharacterized protein n=1 Tax=Exaiptasia diaphana TaxID=2652724 RepID=A0A913XFY8_EXADI|nr:uncharacterized protein LOC110242034 [Exaiptasia diaphana]